MAGERSHRRLGIRGSITETGVRAGLFIYKSGASMKIYGRAPVDLQKIKIPQGQVYIIPERCKGCKICIQFCPQQVLQESKMTNAKGYHYPEITPGREEACVHCEFCTMICPEFAIFTLEVEQ